jgi:hypothetical protein
MVHPVSGGAGLAVRERLKNELFVIYSFAAFAGS